MVLVNFGHIIILLVSMVTCQVAGETLPNSTERAVTISGKGCLGML